MRTLPGRLQAMDPARRDALLALAYLVESAVELIVFIPGRAPLLGFGVLIEVAMAAALAGRRRTPRGAAVLASTAAVGVSLLPVTYQDHLVAAFFVELFVIYSAGRHLDDRKALVVALFGTACQTLASAVDGYDDWFANVFSGVIFAFWAPILIGRFMRHRARLNETLSE